MQKIIVIVAEIQTLIKKYSDHIQVPVKIKETRWREPASKFSASFMD